ncbi:MAG: ATP-dependent helicase [Kiritimatiellae bacterium]|nr:ATP-dependent helicase [Kiritimatiellia bacterium]
MDKDMELTEEQRKVVALSTGRHLVLAPPGSGKTEMLSRRIIEAVKAGVDPSNMLCATFTNRAAFEMRDRVTRDGGDLALPDVGNLHHFCHSFLISAGRLHPGRHVMDEVQQEEFVKEVVDVLRRELCEGGASDRRRSFGVTVLRGIKGICGPSPDDSRRDERALNPNRVGFVRDLLSGYMAKAFENERNPYAEILSGIAVLHQRRIGIPSALVRPYPPQIADLVSGGVIGAIAGAYAGLKRKFRCADFDDLLNETWLHLAAKPLPEERRYSWVQIDEVQDLSPLQWSIVKNLVSRNGVCVYFGDVEQAIFSFLGASAESFAEATADCERHFFRKNFRATPILLEVLMRYSLDALASEWEFLPAPPDPESAGGLLEFAKGGVGLETVANRAKELLESGLAENAAILVRTNKSADAFEPCVKRLGWRYAKVSGVDLFSYAPMRDFMAFVALFTGRVPMAAWAALARRFSRTVLSSAGARYFVRGMFAAGWDPMAILGGKAPVGLLPSWRSASSTWAWRHRKALMNMRKALRPAWLRISSRLEERCTFREVFEVFASIAFEGPALYTPSELSPRALVDGDGKAFVLSHEDGIRTARERIEKFLRYTDHVYADDKRPFCKVLEEDWRRLSKLKEADLLVGDEKIVISTIHKAKGRQFDAVLIPDVKDVAAHPLSDPDEARRLLYVAMSRAKRHLIMWGADVSFVLPLRECFKSGYVNYYLRRNRGEDLSKDWLFDWERLAEMNARHVCDDNVASALVKSASAPVVRMALSALRWSYDAELRRRVYLMALAGTVRGDVSSRAVSCLADCGMFGSGEAGRVRDAALESESPKVARSALGYFIRMAEVSRDEAVDAIGDFIYSRFAPIRVAAAEMLFDFGVMQWVSAVTGSWHDFRRISGIQDPGHEPSIRKIIASRPSTESYVRQLREIIARRALRT